MKISVAYPGLHSHFRSDDGRSACGGRRVYPSASGFTLFELIVTIAVSAILVGIAVPSYRNLIISNRLTTATNDFVAAVNMAKLEAVRRNSAVQLCAGSNNGADTLGTGCSTTAQCATVTGTPEPGTVCLLDGANPTRLYAAPSIPIGITMSMTAALRYGGQGLARRVGDTLPTYTGLLVDLSSDKIPSNNRRCVYITTGSTISSCTVTSTTACPTNEPTTCR